MPGTASGTNPQRKHRGRVLPALMHALGIAVIAAAIVLAASVAVPRLFGFEAFHVISGSMEPELPIHSVIYVEVVSPDAVHSDDVIAFSSGDSVITHRVTDKDPSNRQFITKGDANAAEDLRPVPYDALIGIVRYHIPVLGRATVLMEDLTGKLILLAAVIFGVLLCLWPGGSDYAGTARQSGRRVPVGKYIVMAVMLILCVGSAYLLRDIQRGYSEAEKLYSEAASRFTRKTEPTATDAPTAGDTVPAAEPEETVCAPLAVDFDALREAGIDVVAWIYCEDTVIDYPVVHGEDNDFYLHHSYDGAYTASGSIFTDAGNDPSFGDANTIMYGHHMRDGSMFASLQKWTDQAYMDEHPVMWLLTPEQDYRIELFSAYMISAYADTYTLYSDPSAEFQAYLRQAVTRSDVITGVELEPDGRYILLSTCAYEFDQARSVIHGKLVPVDSAGGVPIG